MSQLRVINAPLMDKSCGKRRDRKCPSELSEIIGSQGQEGQARPIWKSNSVVRVLMFTTRARRSDESGQIDIAPL